MGNQPWPQFQSGIRERSIDNIFVQLGGRLFRQLIGIPVGTNCAPLLTDIFLYSCENE